MEHIFGGILFAVLGYLIKYKKWSWLIAGYNTSSKEAKEKYNIEALNNSVGNLFFLIGGIISSAYLGELLDLDWILSLRRALIIVVSLGAIIYLNTSSRFKKRSE